MEEKTKDLIRIILSLILPPVGVFFQVGFGVHFWLNILLTLLGYFPGLIHAIWVIIKFDDKK
ncbi:YqaE/Pmp3 family membrane protein [Desulfonema magnum]|nr:YqaE/Pmp3 family membrane protein [Desulfonema magnum]